MITLDDNMSVVVHIVSHISGKKQGQQKQNFITERERERERER